MFLLIVWVNVYCLNTLKHFFFQIFCSEVCNVWSWLEMNWCLLKKMLFLEGHMTGSILRSARSESLNLYRTDEGVLRIEKPIKSTCSVFELKSHRSKVSSNPDLKLFQIFYVSVFNSVIQKMTIYQMPSDRLYFKFCPTQAANGLIVVSHHQR